VKNPINNYNIIPYIGHYVNWTDTFMGEKGKLDLSYWTLDYDKEKAAIHFQDVKKMLRAFEYWFGPYPFYEDGYKLVQAPHLGMEHQSSIAYGNKFRKGYLGRDLSNTGWGLKWDYIIVHESGHEWFANNITTNDIADMWVHEGFTTFSEALFVDYYFGSNAANDYVVGVRKGIKNDIPIIGKYNVKQEGSGDMYPKGANILQTIRNSVHNDDLFRKCLRKLNEQFYHSTTTSNEVEKYISDFLQFDYSTFFDQYLRTNKIPTLHYFFDESKQELYLQFKQCIKGFSLPLFINNTNVVVDDHNVQTISLKGKNIQEVLNQINENYYIKIEN
ncbi:MAG: M1 family aminopeptidase, partial [Sediminibacterium sp.]|nr:M1 family aminopeptidase [Sediminibacterium sp.]